MKWKKLGKIFDPTEHELPNGCKHFAQSPQALVYNDFVRIYFSTREVDKSNKFLSHIAFVDFDKTFSQILRVSKKQVIPLGELGCFDQHGIFPMNVIRHEGKVLAYTSGIYRKVSVPVETSIGYAVSIDDGLTFQKLDSGPILTSSLHEPFMVGDPFVNIFNGIYHMWYIFGVKWIRNAETDGAPSRVYKIAHAVSNDGINWNKENRLIIPDKLNADECQALPTVLEHDGIYHMFFCYRQATDFRKNSAGAYRIGYAYSKDLINWQRDDSIVGIDVSTSGWDSEMLCYPHVFKLSGKIYLLYNGNEFGRFGFGLAELIDID